jgi:DNA-directed RNA polymerase specialized sigma24 family protein
MMPAPAWRSADPDLPARMLTLVYRVAKQTGRSRRTSTALCCRVLTASPEVDRRCRDAAAERQVRAHVLVALRADLAPRIGRAQLEAALRDAVLLDEVTLLPPRQRFALWSTAVDHLTTAELATRTGWTPPQIARLLRAALRTVTSGATLPE